MANKLKPEAAVGEKVKAYLLDCGHDVYCEVDSGIGRIDIVAVADRVLTTVELKARLSLDVLGQAISRRPYVHRSIAAFPLPKDSHHKRSVLRSVHQSTGIGIWVVGGAAGLGSGVIELHAPKINRQCVSRHVRDYLRDEQRNQMAGVNVGYWSPFQQTKQSLIKFVKKHPGCTLKEAMQHIKHHYSSHSTAYGSLAKWIRTGVIDEIERREDGLFLKEAG